MENTVWYNDGIGVRSKGIAHDTLKQLAALDISIKIHRKTVSGWNCDRYDHIVDSLFNGTCWQFYTYNDCTGDMFFHNLYMFSDLPEADAISIVVGHDIHEFNNFECAARYLETILSIGML